MKNQLPPHNIETEQSVLCSMILDPDASNEAASQLEPWDFYRTAHQRIFESILSLREKKEPVDLVTLHEQIKQDGNLDEIGGASYLNILTDEVPIAVNIKSYCKTVKDKAIKRRYIEIANAIQKRCFNDEPLESIVEYTDQSHSQLKHIRQSKLAEVYDSKRMVEAYRKYASSLKNNRFITGIHEIDKRIRGVAGGEVLTIIARAGSFKTAWLQNLLKNYINNSAWAAVFFSIEMPIASVTERYFEILDGCTGAEVETMYSDPEQASIKRAAEAEFIKDLKRLYVIPSRVSLHDVSKYIRLIESEYQVKVGVVGIDYLGLMDGPGQNEYEIVSRLARGIKSTAKLINLPVIVLSQVSRKGGSGEAEITLDMGRGSGAIEEGADFVLGLWQVEKIVDVVGADKPPKDYDLICRILKNRKGIKGSQWIIELDPSTLRFGSQAVPYEAEKASRGVTI
jgi:replicative DNA helicase